ncbi:MAG: fused MFS/spermidine synthase [Candidatus Altimarinota bacterium]
MNKKIFEVTVFISGFVVLTYEVVGARVLGPYYGTSIFVWTAMIGIILASLSLGYSLGGKLADKKDARKAILSSMLLLASISIAITYIIRIPLLGYLTATIHSIRIGSVIAAMILFFPASVFLGMISPYALKLRLIGEKETGTIIGNMSALGTIGSILGTFITGFYLIPTFGISTILASLPIILGILSLLVDSHDKKYFKIISLSLFLLFVGLYKNTSASPNIIDERDTMYSHVQVIEGMNPRLNERVRMLKINVENHSSMSLESNRLINHYTEYYHLIRHFFPDFQHALMIGGAGYSFPKEYLNTYSGKTIDVVEIDPGITEVAKQYFFLKEDPRLKIYHEDARVYLNKTSTKYDAIFGDAFTSWFSIPYQLTTSEAIQKQYDSLTESGVLILNLISSLDGETGEFFRSEYHTFKDIFPEVIVFPTSSQTDGNLMQNIILIGLKDPHSFHLNSHDPYIKNMLSTIWTGAILDDLPRITDDYAPVDYYMSKLLD